MVPGLKLHVYLPHLESAIVDGVFHFLFVRLVGQLIVREEALGVKFVFLIVIQVEDDVEGSTVKVIERDNCLHLWQFGTGCP